MPPKSKEECQICTENLNVTRRKPVECPYCKFSVCRECVRRSITIDTRDPQCVSCKAVWDREFLETVLQKSFMTSDYRVHRREVLLERAKARMPEYQQKAHNELTARGIDQLVVKLGDEIKALMERINEIRAEIAQQQRTAHLLRTGQYKQEVHRENKFVRGCPKDGCRGFLDARYTCGICETKCCRKCHLVMADKKEHECNADDVATAELLKKDTRSCPKCSIPIFKIDGCDQMWCPECKTAFSWRTGQIETGRVHNPHYYEWMRRNGTLPREPGDQPAAEQEHVQNLCNNGLPEYTSLMNWANGGYYRYDYYGSKTTPQYRLQTIHRHLTHIRGINVRNYEGQIREATNTDGLYVKYLLGDIQEEELKYELLQREKDTQKATALLQIFQMVLATSNNLLFTTHFVF